MKSNIIGSILLQVSNYSIPLIAVPILTRKITVSELGEYFLLLTAITIISFILDFGVNIYGQKRLTKLFKEKDDCRIRKFLSAVILTRVITTIFTFILISVFNLAFMITDLMYIILIILGSVMLSAQNIWYYLSRNTTHEIGIINMLGKVLFIFVLISNTIEITVQNILIIWVLHLGFIAAISYVNIGISIATLKLPNRRYYFAYVKVISSYFLAKVASMVYTLATPFVVNTVSTLEGVAYYRIAEQFYRLGQGVVAPIINSLYPKLRSEPSLALFRKWRNVVLILVCLYCVAVFIFAEELISMMYGTAYVISYGYVLFFLPILIINALGTIYGYPAYAVFNKSSQANMSIVWASCLFILVSTAIILFEFGTIWIVCVSIFITETFVLIFRLIQLDRIKYAQ